ncbi:uncharacterized protein PAC_10317 [Phialocephala subalpina]|uniref:Uncharacterized protein n=1 Tax=Phialocephala subalpina TaxID=576137 RepID=A0A1L7X5X8_9HELO|nr:uncharacterized protein PAC_10317 [Phialocephala subalpina]
MMLLGPIKVGTLKDSIWSDENYQATLAAQRAAKFAPKAKVNFKLRPQARTFKPKTSTPPRPATSVNIEKLAPTITRQATPRTQNISEADFFANYSPPHLRTRVSRSSPSISPRTPPLVQNISEAEFFAGYSPSHLRTRRA